MSLFQIKKVYTENPYVDELIYYTKLMGLDTVLKMQQVADNAETVESLKAAGIYIACVEGTAIFEQFSSIPQTKTKTIVLDGVETELNEGIAILIEAGMPYQTSDDVLFLRRCLQSIQVVPEKYRSAIVPYLEERYIEDYVELNSYYRMLHGQPPIGKADYVTNWDPPEGLKDKIDLSKPIHEMTSGEIAILNSSGVIQDMFEEDKENRQYMQYLTKKKISYYSARRAQRFDVLYCPTIDSDAVENMYRERLNQNKLYTLKTVYSEAFAYNSDYYDNFIAVFIVLITVVDIISRVQEFIARKEIFDIRSIQWLFESYGVPFFEEIPYKYQVAMIKNIHTLLKYKSTAKCMVDICSLFGFKNIKIFKYFLLRDRHVDLKTMDYITAVDEDGNEDLDAEYELKFLKLPLEDDLDEYIRVASNYIDYDEITENDPRWDGGLQHEDVKQAILKEEFDFIRTKYISIDTTYDIAKLSAQQTYFFNMIFDNAEYENLITVKVPFIAPGREFTIPDIFILLIALTYRYNGIKDIILRTQSNILYINGFIFKADLAAIAADTAKRKVFEDAYKKAVEEGFEGTEEEWIKYLTYKGDKIKVNGFNFKADIEQLKKDIGPKTLRGSNNTQIVVDPGSTIHAREQLNAFEVPVGAIPSFNEMMDMYVNNMNVRDELIKGMNEADNKKVYDVYNKLYDALMIVELTFKYFRNPKTGEFYLDEDGDPTYTEFLRNKDPDLYDVLMKIDTFDDKASRNQYISNLIDSIVYALEEFIDPEEFQGIFSNLPGVSSEAVKYYIATVINFYKSFKVDFLGLNTVYILDDKYGAVIRIIDDMILGRYFQRNEVIDIIDTIAKNHTTLEPKERINLIERMYMDIKTWIKMKLDEHIIVDDQIAGMVYRIVIHTIVQITEEMYGFQVSFNPDEDMIIHDFIYSNNISMESKDDISINDRLYVLDTYKDTAEEAENDYMDFVNPEDKGKIIVASSTGNSRAASRISEDIMNKTSSNVVTEKAVADYVAKTIVDKQLDIVASDQVNTENASNDKAASEKAIVEGLSFTVIK